jgi:guanylate kinase/GNAT superfamily N-acetyltransferase
VKICPSPNKKKYKSRAEAQQAANYRMRQGAPYLSVYQCGNHWHITSTPSINPPVKAVPSSGQFTMDVTGEFVKGASVLVTANGASAELDVGTLEAPPSGELERNMGNLIRINMFRRKAGFQILNQSKQPDYIVSVEQGNKHYYAKSEVKVDGYARLKHFPDKKSEPRLRVETRGSLELGDKIGTLSVRGKEHPLYDRIMIRQQFGNPPAEGVKWEVKYTPYEKLKAGPRGVGLMMPNMTITGLHPDGETKITMSLSIYELGKRFKKITLPNGKEKYLKKGVDPEDGKIGYKFGDSALNRYDWIQKQGFTEFAYINGIGVSHPDDHTLDVRMDQREGEEIHVGAGKGMGQAAYLYAAKILAKRGMPLLSTNPSKSATRAWDKVEANLPPNYHMERLEGEGARKKLIARLLWYEPIGNPPGIPKTGKELTPAKKKEIRKKWLELVNMTHTELQRFYDSDLGNKRAGLSRDEAKEQGISSGRDSALAIIKMKQTPVKEWSKTRSKDRGRDIMLDFWQWAQKQINFNTRHRGMQGPYLDEKGRPTRKLLGLWIWGHDPWRYALEIKSERMPTCPDFPWIGRKEKQHFGVIPKVNPISSNPLAPVSARIITVSGPSGAGKSTLVRAIKKRIGKATRIVPSIMTRKRRPQEKEGIDGIFIEREKFEEMIENGEFKSSNGTDLWVGGGEKEYYGRKAADFEQGGTVIVDADFSGVELYREAFPGKVYSVFINTSMGPEQREKVLRRRGVHSEEEIERRVRIGSSMLQPSVWQKYDFDFITKNRFGEVDNEARKIASEFKKAKEKVNRRKPKRKNPNNCPPATQNLELNTKNRNNAIQAPYIRYGPLNLSDKQYYIDAAEHWKTTPDVAKRSKCSNCIAFDISPRMLDCMPGPVSAPIEDEEGYLGYCWMHHFKCHSARTCYTWAAGGPISQNKISFEWQERNAQIKPNPPTSIKWEIRPHPDLEDDPSITSSFLVGELDGEEIIGVIFNDEGDKYHIDHIWVERKHRGKGYSKATLNWFKSIGKPIELYAPIQSGKAPWSKERGRRDWYKGMYERQGFVEIDPQRGLMRWEPQVKKNPPATMLTGFQRIGSKQDSGKLYLGKGKVIDAKPTKTKNTPHPIAGKRYMEGKRDGITCTGFDNVNAKGFSLLPFEARRWKKSTFKSGGETKFSTWMDKLQEDKTPYMVTLKVDGEGCMAHFDEDETVIWNWYDRWRADFKVTEEITAKLKKAGVKQAKIMGELYAVGKDGNTLPFNKGKIVDGMNESVSSIIKSTGDKSTMERQNRIRFAGFDILEIDGEDLRETPFEMRIAIVEQLLGHDGVAKVVPIKRGTGIQPLKDSWEEWSQDPEFEGGVIRFVNGKTFKVKGVATVDLAVIGFFRGGDEREGHKGSMSQIVGGLALAFMDEDGNYIFAGNVGTGFKLKEREEMIDMFVPEIAKGVVAKSREIGHGPYIWGDHRHAYAVRGEGGKIQTHDDRGRGTMFPITPFKVAEIAYRSLNWGQQLAYEYDKKDRVYKYIGTRSAPTLSQPSFKRWREDKGQNPFDLRLSQVAAEGEGKWIKKNPIGFELGPQKEGSVGVVSYKLTTGGESEILMQSGFEGMINPSRAYDIWSNVADILESKGFELTNREEAIEHAATWMTMATTQHEAMHVEVDQEIFPELRRPGMTGKEMFQAITEQGTPKMEHMADIAAQMVYDQMPAIRFEHNDGVFVVTIGANMQGGITIDIEDIRNNPPAEIYPGGIGRMMLDEILLGSLKQDGVMLADWRQMYPELAYRLDSAKQLGFTVEMPQTSRKNPVTSVRGGEIKVPKKLYQVPLAESIAHMDREEVKKDKDVAYIFGDNEDRKGTKGQAEIRGLPNAFGIRTKKSPSMRKSAFWSDDDYKESVKMMADDFLALFMSGYTRVKIPESGLGTGLAELPQRAPRTFSWLQSMIGLLLAQKGDEE